MKHATLKRAPNSCFLRPMATIGGLIAAAALSGCVVGPPPGPILSRLSPDQPGAVSSARRLTDAEMKRYAEIDKQVLREQNEAMAMQWTRYYAPYYASPVVYGGYGGYYSGWGVGYYSPGYSPRWWW
jgi:hypothetical protein